MFTLPTTKISQALIVVFVAAIVFFFGGVHPVTQIGLHGVLVLLGFWVLKTSKTLDKMSLLGAKILCIGCLFMGVSMLPLSANFGTMWPEETLQAMSVWVLVGGFGVWFSVICQRNMNDKWISQAIMSLAMMVGAFVLLHIVLGTQNVLNVWVARDSTDNMIPPFVNHNHTATFAIWALPVLLALERPTLWLRAMRGVGVVVLLAILLWSKSVGALLGIFVAVYLWRSRGWAGWLRWVSVVASAVACGTAGRVLLHYTRSLWEMESYSMRLTIWEDVLHFAWNRPLLGTGAGTFQNVYRAWGSYGVAQVPHAHSEILHWWIEWGLLSWIGIGLFVWLFLRLESGLSGIRYALWLGVVAVLFHSLVDFQLHIPGIAVLILGSVTWIAVGSRPREVWSAGYGRTVVILILVGLQAAAGLTTFADWRTDKVMGTVHEKSSVSALEVASEQIRVWDVWGHKRFFCVRGLKRKEEKGQQPFQRSQRWLTPTRMTLMCCAIVRFYSIDWVPLRKPMRRFTKR